MSKFKFRYSRAFCNVQREIGEVLRVYYTVEMICKIYKTENYDLRVISGDWEIYKRVMRVISLWSDHDFHVQPPVITMIFRQGPTRETIFSIILLAARLKPPRERKRQRNCRDEEHGRKETKNEENIAESLHYKVWWGTLARSPYERDLHEARVEKNLWSDHIGRTGVPVRRRNKRLAIRLASADHIDRGYLHSQWYLPVLSQPDFAIIGQRAAVHGSKDPPRFEMERSLIELITDDDSLSATCGRR